MKRFFSILFIFAFNLTVLSFNHTTEWCNNSDIYNGIPDISISDVESLPGTSHAVGVSFSPISINHTSGSCSRDSDTLLRYMSVEQLTDYFRGCSSAAIFSKTNLPLLTSDTFVTYIKQFPEYEGYIEHFHEKFHKSSKIKQWLRKEIGKRLCQLYKEVKTEKKLQQVRRYAVAQEQQIKQQLISQHAYLHDIWQRHYVTAKPAHKVRLKCRIHTCEKSTQCLLSTQRSPLTVDAVNLLHTYAIDQAQVASVHGTAVEHVLQQEFITITHEASSHIYSREDPHGDLLMEGIDVGTIALQKKHTVLASQAADFCWAMLDLVQAAGEGVVLAGYNTAAFMHQLIRHPQDTVQAFIEGICTIADTLFIINDLPDQLREYDIPNKDYYYRKIAQTEQQLEDLGKAAAQRVKEMKLRDWVKHGTAFVVEGILFHKVTQMIVNASSYLRPLCGNLLRSIECEEIMAVCADGEKISLHECVSKTERGTFLIQETEDNVCGLNNVIMSSDIIRTDLIDTANHCIELEKKWVSRAGLIYGTDKKFGTRINHVLQHIKKSNAVKLQHTIFSVEGDELLQLIDNAWLKRGASLPDDVGVFIVDMGQSIGTLHETHIKIVVIPNTCEILTAYPIKV